MMSVSLLSTKLFFPPARHDLVPRPQLIERLDSGLRGPLTLLSAPAGYGKTTLLSQWRTGIGRDIPAAWISLDAADGDLILFLRYLTTALDSLQTNLVGKTVLLLQSPQQPPLDAILASLVNELGDYPENFILILDDYHTILAPAIHDTIAFLLAHAPLHMHLAILTREDPPLPLSKLRARGQLTEIREADLRFSLEETAAFLTQTMGLTLSENAVTGLSERTEGWIAGLQMAGLSLQKRSETEEFVTAFRGKDRYVMDFLMDEVFAGQPEEIQSFLLQTSILERLCGPLCDVLLEVTEQDKVSTPSPTFRGPFKTSQEILEYLEHCNLFILPLDNKREWYRFHSLFADLLRYRLQRLYPGRLSELHRRACRWYMQAGNADEAMKHALAAPDHVLAADLAEQFLLQMTGSSRLSTYLSWVQNLPEEVIYRRAYLCAGCGWAYVLTHQPDAAGRYLYWGQRALPRFDPIYSAPDGRWISSEEVAGNLAAIHSYADRLKGDLPGALQHARQAMDVLPPEALAVRCAVALNLGMLHLDCGELDMARQALGEAFETASQSRENVFVAVSALSMLGGILATQGKLREAEGVFHRAIHFGTEEGKTAAPVPSVGVIHGWLVAVHYQRNEIAAAQEHLDVVLQSVEQMGVPETTVRAYLYQALLTQTRGEFSAAKDWFRRAEELMQVHPMNDLIQTEWMVFRGQFYLQQGELAPALELLERQGVRATDLEQQVAPGSEKLRLLGPRLARYLLLARTLLARGARAQAADLLEKVSFLAEGHADFAILLEALSHQAVAACQNQRGTAQALLYLSRALELAASEGYVRPFLNAGGSLIKLLRQAIAQGIQPAYAHTLYAELIRQEREQVSVLQSSTHGAPLEWRAATAGSNPQVAPLTERERQVLRLLGAGLSSTEIAEELVISVNTARSYIKSIYGKIDVHGRDEAIERGKQIGLI